MREKSNLTRVARDLFSTGCVMNQNFLSLLDKKLPNGTVSHALEVPLGGTCVSRKEALYTVVGASVAVCLIDTETAWCSLRQVMLPSLARGHRQDAMMQADAALEDAVTRLLASAGIDTDKLAARRIKAKLFGGSDLKATGISYSDGEQSTSFSAPGFPPATSRRPPKASAATAAARSSCSPATAWFIAASWNLTTPSSTASATA
jgi:chemotaxis receptor (MCP) glutamine deamidase CheD